jgi:hypothetical protein
MPGIEKKLFNYDSRVCKIQSAQSCLKEEIMKKEFVTVPVILILIFLCFNVAYAQAGKSGWLKFYGDFKPVIGGWSEYEVTQKGQSPVKMKIAVVGKEGDAYWYETVMDTKGEGKMITKMLVSGNPDDRKNVKRMIVKMGNEPAMEMPVMTQASAAQKEPAGKIIDKGSETIKVPAGSFKTQHTQYQGKDVVVDSWVYKDVSPYGMIKSQSKDFEMVLVSYGTGAKTLITETPKKFEMPAMPQMPSRMK